MPKKKSSSPDLFDAQLKADLKRNAPLADRMRPVSLDDFVGQEEIIGQGKPLRMQILNDNLSSLIFWGPPGTGKTTLAKIIAETTKSVFLPLSAIGWTAETFREQAAKILERRKLNGQRTILFVDEIHRLNKAQQDQLLPYLEKGIITMIGATTENPSFELNSALLSRSQVYVLKSLDHDDLCKLAKRALLDTDHGLGSLDVKIDESALNKLCELANGDARILYNLLERAVFVASESKKITAKIISELTSGVALIYDRAGEEHYNLISALHKCMRDGDADAALYWLGRMISGGEDPLYIARRVVRFASEDVGLADTQALSIAIAAKEAVHFIGLPECDVALAQAVAYCANAKKSNALYQAMIDIKKDIKLHGNLPVPENLRNATTKLAKDLGYGRDYKYWHKDPAGAEKQEHLPVKLKGKKYLKEIK
ncbi:MAG: replication-associated recombination protein A [Patescibacteria group bacterium]|nr:replication-associated recombination protein A [Patescibacteria group bacterium]